MLEVKDGKIFVEGVETIDAELIGMAFKDTVEENKNSYIMVCNDKKLISIIENEVELKQITEFAIKELEEIDLCRYFEPFTFNWPSSSFLYSFIMMIKDKRLIFSDTKK